MCFTPAANVGSVFLASGASAKCVLLCCVNALEGVFLKQDPLQGSTEGLNVLTNAHMQYVHVNVHIHNRNFFGNHRKPSVMTESCKCYQIYTL